ncbi:hypothetical protein [Sinorhizobium alkalisoli]|uniref:Alpha/beta hydrolase n=1 Tax=Sinorhizobium alkalisoli TaxID=1752398 RepID=A0A1E3VCQ8_9HYPH|nr:hypothetical protein [Sinorhizobium alkalisoli]MCA1493583.1 alpha/beta hydrolase [Ensifer sp. NBAIM29]MCG5480580.1 alpha/beta hydrolase [Sinorhizobium alkalisoli]ODR91378.1 hypothetical protein A8M32_11340 [Sinorhizobium alkalisoli]
MRVLVVTDIHGKPGAADCLSRHLPGREQSVIRTIGLPELLGADCTGESLHRHLVESDGFVKAAKRLVDLANDADVALGYSAGGMVLWQAALHGLSLDRLICVSSTRLRHVSSAATPVPVLAVFGENDPNRPADAWAAGSGVKAYIIPRAEHEFYGADSRARDLCLARIVDFLRQPGADTSGYSANRLA